MEPAFQHLYWVIDDVLAGMPMPYIALDRRMNLGGALDAYEDELRPLERAGIKALVCLLNLPGDAPVFESAGFGFRCCPISNGQPPSRAQIAAIVPVIDDYRARQ